MSALKAGLYACSPEALAAIVDRAASKLAAIVNDPAYVLSHDRLTAYMEMIGIEVGEIRHAAAAEKRASEQKLQAARVEIERLRFELAKARHEAEMAAAKCQGCDQCTPTRRYLVTFHNGTSEHVRYCDDCASLARMDCNGETASIAEAA